MRIDLLLGLKEEHQTNYKCNHRQRDTDHSTGMVFFTGGRQLLTFGDVGNIEDDLVTLCGATIGVGDLTGHLHGQRYLEGVIHIVVRILIALRIQHSMESVSALENAAVFFQY